MTTGTHFNPLASGRCGTDLKNIIVKLITQNSSMGRHYETALWWTPQNLTNEKSTSVQVMASAIL